MTTRLSLALLFLLTLTACRNSFFGVDEEPTRWPVLEFDGADDYLTVAQSPSLSFDGAFTVEAWIYPNNVKTNPGGGERTILRKGFSRVDTTDYRQTTNYHLFFDVRRGSGVLAFQGAHTSKRAVLKQEWSHVAGVFNPQDSSSTIYINGEKAARITGDLLPVPNTAPLSIGLSLEEDGGVQDMYDGVIRDVRLWNTARTPEELRETMHKTLVGSEAGLVASWTMDAGRGQTVIDGTGTHPAVLGSTDATEDVDPKWTRVDILPPGE